MPKTVLTKTGHRKLTDELEYLTRVKRKEIADALAHARSFGDLSENAEYDAAKHAFDMNETRIRELQDKLSGAEIVNEEDIPRDKAFLGARVTVIDLEYDDEEEFHLVTAEEADPAKGMISVDSPVGKGLLGHQPGDEVEIAVPRGTLRFKIKAIARD